MEGQRSLNARSVEKDIMDSVGHEATHHLKNTHRKEDGKVIEKGMAMEHRRVASPKEEKVEPKGKGKGKKGQRLNEITEPPEEQWSGGSWEQWPD